MKIREVQTAADKKAFLQVAKDLYRDDPHWVCPLDSEIEAVFDPAQNKYFKNGEAIRWLLYDEEDRLIGRVAAFIDRKRSEANRQPTGGMGYFEVINQKEAAFLLMNTARKWLEVKGMQAMDGPINFGENDTHWGLLVEGFMQQGMGMPYNHAYYKAFFEEYGFRNYFEQYSYHLDLTQVDIFPPRLMKIASWIAKKPDYSFKHFSFSEAEGFIDDMSQIYDATWSVFKEDFTPLDKKALLETMHKSKPIIDEELIWFAYHKGKPVAFFILFPDMNQIIKGFNGRLCLGNKIRFLIRKKQHRMTRMRALVAGVHPSYQNTGIESAIFHQLYFVFKRKPWYQELELSWVGDFNPKMRSIYEALNARQAKTHITYRYMFDPEAHFIRYKDEMEQRQNERLEKLKEERHKKEA